MSTAVERAAARRHHEACVRAVDAAKGHAAGLWDALAEVHQLEAWRLGGHSSFAEWAQRELDVSARQSYRYLAKAREAIAIADVSGISTDEAAEEVPLSPKRERKPRVEVFDNAPKVMGLAVKLTDGLSHLNMAVPLSDEAARALRDLLTSIERVLKAPQGHKGVASGVRVGR